MRFNSPLASLEELKNLDNFNEKEELQRLQKEIIDPLFGKGSSAFTANSMQ